MNDVAEQVLSWSTVEDRRRKETLEKVNDGEVMSRFPAKWCGTVVQMY
jgi:hypothetical protein